MKNLILRTVLSFLCIILFTLLAHAQVVNVGSGSYTTTFPGYEFARRATPDGSPKVTGPAATKKIPTSDWWSALIWTKNAGPHGQPIYAYPLAFRSTQTGLAMEYTFPTQAGRQFIQPMSAVNPIVVGVTGVSASESKIYDHTDWTVTPTWNDGVHDFRATIGMAMPFTYFEKGNNDVAEITLNFGSTVSIQNEVLLITNSYNGGNFVFYAPIGSTWTNSGNKYTSTLNGKNYWSMAFLPQGVTDLAQINTLVNDYKQYAYVFPSNTTVSWDYDENTSKSRATYQVTTDVKEGTNNVFLQGLLPHQWGNLAADSDVPSGNSYNSVRGEIKPLASNNFIVEHSFKGILPTLPDLGRYSNSYDALKLYQMLDEYKGAGLNEYTDSYNQGVDLNKFTQLARIANQLGHIEARDNLVSQVKTRLEDWLSIEPEEETFTPGDTYEFTFYYHDEWDVLLGYPAGHYQDANLNDRHFHWGYFIQAATLVAEFNPGWASQWGGMVEMLIRDASSPDRNDSLFPFLRNFSPFAGHSWADGSGNYPNGNNQESSSESMNYNSSLIFWGTITGNTQIRDLGIHLYTTEQSAIEEYWWDVNNRTFQPSYQHEAISRVWGSGYDGELFWTNDISAMWGINFVPLHGGSMYLGHNVSNVQNIWNDIVANTGIMNQISNPNLWDEVYWQYLSFADPAQAITLMDAYPNYQDKFGESKARTYHWLHNMNALGQVDASVTANYPLATVFLKNGTKTYVAHNYSNQNIIVNFSDGFNLSVPANQMKTSRDLDTQVTLTSPLNGSKFPSGNNTITLEASVNTNAGVTSVKFYEGNNYLGEDNTAPYQFTLNNVSDYVYNYTAHAHIGSDFETSDFIQVQVGKGIPQHSYTGTPQLIPGTIEGGQYDIPDENISGQNVTYYDVTSWNEGNARQDEAVDVSNTNGEGLTVGWVDGGEWLEFTVNVQEAGIYKMDLRYATPNNNVGGFFIEFDDVAKSSAQTVNSTGDWGNFQTFTIENLALNAGIQIMKFNVGNGGYNFGRMTFTKTADLNDTEAPSNPSSFSVSDVSCTSAQLSWNASTDNVGVTGYDIYLNNSLVGSTTNLSYTLTGLSCNTSNTAEVIAKDAAGNVSLGSTLNFTTPQDNTDTQAPSAPGNLITVSKTTNSISISWTASTDNVGVSSYDIYKDGILDGNTSGLNYTLTGLQPNTSYSIHVRAKDAAGNVSLPATLTERTENENSGENCTGDGIDATGNGLDYTYEMNSGANPLITFKPARTGVGQNIVILFYEIGGHNPGAYPGYIMNNDGNGNYVYTINGAENQEVSFYFTYSLPEGGEANNINDKHLLTIGNCGGGSVDTQAPTIPGNFLVTATSTNSISVSWTASTDNIGITSYDVYRDNNLISSTSNLYYNHTGLSPNTSYNLQVRATDAAGNTSGFATLNQSTDQENTGGVCTGDGIDATGNGIDYTYEMTNTVNPVLTFKPERTGVGLGIVILFYNIGGHSPGAYPGYILTNNGNNEYEYQIIGAMGEDVSFYFTYSLPEGGEANNMSAKHIETIGNCTGSPKQKNFNIENVSNKNTFSIFPNPAKNSLTFEINVIKENQKIVIYDLNGKKLMMKEIKNSIGNFNISNLNKGMYIISLINKNGIVHRRFVKE